MALPRIERHKLVILTAAVGITSLITTGFLIESRYGYPKHDPIMIYFNSWKADRTETQAFADQKKTLLIQRQEIADAAAKVDKHTNDRDKARLKAMAAANAEAIERLGADKP